MTSLIIFATLIPIALALLAWAISRSRYALSLVKTSPFECGFEGFSTTRYPFSLKFFLVVIVFLVFDLEILVLIPIPLRLSVERSVAPKIVRVVVLLILL